MDVKRRFEQALATSGQVDVKTALAALAEGACPQLPVREGMLAIHVAAQEDHPDLVRALIDAKSYGHYNKSALSRDKKTPLDYAPEDSESYLVLKEHNCISASEMNSARRSWGFIGDTRDHLLALAVSESEDERTERLLEDDPEANTDWDERPEEIAELLWSGANPDARTEEGYTALASIIDYGDAEVEDLLLIAGANPNETCPLGHTVLELALVWGTDTETQDKLRAAGGTENLDGKIKALTCADLKETFSYRDGTVLTWLEATAFLDNFENTSYFDHALNVMKAAAHNEQKSYKPDELVAGDSRSVFHRLAVAGRGLDLLESGLFDAEEQVYILQNASTTAKRQIEKQVLMRDCKTVHDLARPNRNGETPFARLVELGQLDWVLEKFAQENKNLNSTLLTTGMGEGKQTPLKKAESLNQLHKVFAPHFWKNNLADMYRTWECVSDIATERRPDHKYFFDFDAQFKQMKKAALKNLRPPRPRM